MFHFPGPRKGLLRLGTIFWGVHSIHGEKDHVCAGSFASAERQLMKKTFSSNTYQVRTHCCTSGVYWYLPQVVHPAAVEGRCYYAWGWLHPFQPRTGCLRENRFSNRSVVRYHIFWLWMYTLFPEVLKRKHGCFLLAVDLVIHGDRYDVVM